MPRWAIDITAGTGGFDAATKRISATTKRATDKATKYHQQAASKSASAWSVATKTFAVGTMLTGAAVAFKGYTQAIIDNRNELGDMSARTALASDTLQALRLQAEGVGLAAGDLYKVGEKLPLLLSKVEAGGKLTTEAFRKLGIETKNADGSIISSEDALRGLIKGLENASDGSEKARAAMALLGRQGATSLQAFAAGFAQFEQNERIVKRFGVSTGPEASAAAARMQEEMARMGLVARGAGDDLWEAFGGDDGGVGALKAMSSSLIFATELIVRMRKGIEGESNLETIENLLAPWQSGTRMDALAAALTGAKDSVQEYLIETDRADRIAAKGAKAMDALNTEIERNNKATRDATDPQEQYQKELSTLADLVWGWNEDQKTGAEKLTRAYNEQTEAVMAIGEAHQWTGEIGMAAMLALDAADKRLTRDKDALREEEIRKEEEAASRIAEAHKREREKRMAEEARYRAIRADGERDLAYGIIDLGTQVATGAGKTGRQVWRAQQAGAYATALLNTTLAISEASASAPPPYNLIPMAAAGIQGAALVASIASSPAPQAYTGLDAAYASSLGTQLPPIVHPGERIRVETRSEVESSRKPQAAPIVRTFIDGREIATTVEDQTHRGGPLQASLDRRYGRLGRSRDYRSI